MTRKILDLRELACPEPVLAAKRAFEDQSLTALEALVKDEVNVNNLRRLAQYLQAQITVEPRENYYCLTLFKGEGEKKGLSETSAGKPAPEKSTSDVVVFLAKDGLGEGEPDFSRSLLNVFLQTILAAGNLPRAILLANSGVKLMAQDCPAKKVLDDFRLAGCSVLACGLCLEYYGLSQDVPKEQVTNMFNIQEFLFAAGKVLTP